MTADQLQIQLIAVTVAVACALPGTFLVLRRLSLVSDAITHTVLLGIVLAFFLTRSLTSPWLIVGAAAAGVLTVSLVELLQRTRLVREDAAIGLVFPALFSLAVLLISTSPARSVHLDEDAVLLGHLELAPEERLSWDGRDLGPKVLYVNGGVLLANLAFIVVFYKELKLASFDAALAAAFGFSPWLLHYALMTLVSLTAVSVFNAVGSILVVAFMIGPPVTAYLLTDRLSRMLWLSAGLAAACALGGFWVAYLVRDVNIGGAMASMVGLVFAAAWLLAPGRGLIARARLRRRQRWQFAQTMLAIHLLNHEGRPEAEVECRLASLHEHLRWKPAFVDQVVRRALRDGIIERQADYLVLTPAGRSRARESMLA
jgi:manganese/zinc/iron transport system permease protein